MGRNIFELTPEKQEMGEGLHDASKEAKEKLKNAPEKIGDWIFGPRGPMGWFPPNRWLWELYKRLNREKTVAIVTYDPLVLDLDGDGIEAVKVNGLHGAIFDHDNDGIATASGWVKSDDGILVFDRNNDGIINDGSELFGDNTLLSNGEKAANGFAALADLDSNNDGVIDAKDKYFESIKVWRDLNQDGKTDAGELFTLKQLQIASLELGYENVNKNLGDGNILAQLGSYTKTDGTVHQMGDLDLAADHLNSEFLEKIELTEEQAKQIDMQGSGRVRDLREAATLSIQLNNILTSYTQLQTRDEQLALIDDLVQAWAKTDATFGGYTKELTFSAIDPNSKNVIYVTPSQAKQMGLALNLAQEELEGLRWMVDILDSFSGEKTYQLNLLPDPNKVFDVIRSAYQSLLDSTYNNLLSQTRLKPYLDQVDFSFSENENFCVDYSSMNQLFLEIYEKDPKKAVVDLAEMTNVSNLPNWWGSKIFESWTVDFLNNGRIVEMSQWLEGINPYGKTLYGSAGADTIVATGNSHMVLGGDGNDIITANVGNKNFLDGGSGNDTITGRGIINGGTGNDVIDLQISGSADTLIFNLGDGQDTINSYDSSSGYGARDKIIFGKGITKDMISYLRQGNDLIVMVGDKGDQMSFVGYFSSTYKQNFHRFEFADGSVWEDIRKEVFKQYYSDKNDTVIGTIWNDSILGGEGNDSITDISGINYLDGGDGNDTLTGTTNNTLIGGAGNDLITGGGLIHGGTGNDVINLTTSNSADTLIFNLGDGQDTINSYDSSSGYGARDKIIFGKGITKDMISYLRQGNDLIVMVGDKGDQMSFVGYFSSTYKQNFHRFEFADGSVWEDIRKEVFKQYYSDKNDTVIGTIWNDSILGGEGNDSITDISGINYLDGGDGNDTLTGTTNNTLIGGAGNDLITGGGLIHGGTGNDVINLTTSNSADTLIFNLGDGQDTINSYDSSSGYGARDKIIFGKGITKDMISYLRQGNDLIVMVGDKGDQMSFAGYFSSGYKQNFHRFEFADETIWEDIRQTEEFKADIAGKPRANLFAAEAFARSFGVTSEMASIENQVNNLISTMSSFAVEGSASTLLTNSCNEQESLLLAVNAM